MDLKKKLEQERKERAAARKAKIINNRMTPKQLKELLEDDAVHLSHRDDCEDMHKAKRWSLAMTKDFLNNKRVDGDRDPTPQRINGLRMRIAACRIPFNWAVVFNQEDDTVYRINGNTTANLALEYPELFEGSWVFFSEFVSSTTEEMNLLYAQYDSMLSARKIADALLPFVISFGVEIKAAVVSTILSAVNMFYQDHLPKGSFEDRLSTLYDHIPFLYWVGDNILLSKTQVTGPFTRAPVMTAMFATWNCPGLREKAKEFWRRVIYTNENSYEPGDPCLALSRKIANSKAPRSAGDYQKYKLQYCWCVLAWNAFLTGGKLRTFHVYKDKTPPEMNGLDPALQRSSKFLATPYEGVDD
jgi:hypothetical protein